MARSIGRRRLPAGGAPHKRRNFERICDRIRQQLADGELRPGDKLPAERELARELNVGRNALREALRSLEIAGVIELKKGSKGGAFVRSGDLASMTRVMQDLMHLGAVSIENLAEARQALMSVVVQFACDRATESDFLALEANIAHTHAATLAGNYDDRVRYGTEFYHLLALATRNEVLTLMVNSVTEILLRFLRTVAGGTPQPGLIESRRRFLKHLKVRNARLASREIDAHLQRLHRRLMQYHKRQTVRGVVGLRNDDRHRSADRRRRRRPLLALDPTQK